MEVREKEATISVPGTEMNDDGNSVPTPVSKNASLLSRLTN